VVSILFVPLSLPKAFQGSPGYFAKPLQDGHQGFPSLFPSPSKPIQGVPSLSKPFFRKKRLFIFCSPLFPPLSMTANQANPYRKSTVACPKTTADLGYELLIWVKIGLQTLPLPADRPSFTSITTRKWKRANRIQTDTGQKMNPLTVDLGCATASGRCPSRGNPLWTKMPFYSSIVSMANPSKAAGNNNPANPLPFEEALKKLEDIVEAMEADDLPLETLLSKYEEGTRLVKQCRGKLSEAELKIQQLEKNADKEMKLKPFEAEETI
jgi:exodeoxyribonuclease VII small subunit